jgi:hypothetical protein
MHVDHLMVAPIFDRLFIGLPSISLMATTAQSPLPGARSSDHIPLQVGALGGHAGGHVGVHVVARLPRAEDQA